MQPKKLWTKLARQWMAVFLAFLLAAPALPAAAEEGQTGAVSGGDAAAATTEAGAEPEAGENADDAGAAEEEVVPHAEGDIASGTDSGGNISWVIDGSGKLTVNGTGDFTDSLANERSLWRQYCGQITSAEVAISGITDISYMFTNCTNMTSLDLSGLDTSQVTDMRNIRIPWNLSKRYGVRTVSKLHPQKLLYQE